MYEEAEFSQKAYSRTERGYSIFKKEILALLYTLKTMDYFLRFADKLTILVDAKSIVYLKLAKDSSGILLRFSLELSKYNADICHVSGEENIVYDVLSIAPRCKHFIFSCSMYFLVFFEMICFKTEVKIFSQENFQHSFG